jgi:hypothetical protein
VIPSFCIQWGGKTPWIMAPRTIPPDRTHLKRSAT